MAEPMRTRVAHGSNRGQPLKRSTTVRECASSTCKNQLYVCVCVCVYVCVWAHAHSYFTFISVGGTDDCCMLCPLWRTSATEASWRTAQSPPLLGYRVQGPAGTRPGGFQCNFHSFCPHRWCQSAHSTTESTCPLQKHVHILFWVG